MLSNDNHVVAERPFSTAHTFLVLTIRNLSLNNLLRATALES